MSPDSYREKDKKKTPTFIVRALSFCGKYRTRTDHINTASVAL